MKRKKMMVAAAMLCCSQLPAQDISVRNPSDSSEYLLREVVVTASKYARKQSETGKVLSVITREQLESSGAQSLGEILNRVPGTFIIGANNSPGTNLTASIRGSSAGNVLILIDGIPVNDPSVISNYFDLNFLVPSQVERIEILKGGQSTLYGSDAVAGVINIITRKAVRALQAHASLAAGSYRSGELSAGVMGKGKKADFSLQYFRQGSKGFSSALDSTGTNGYDRDGIRQEGFQARAGYRLHRNWKWNLFGSYNRYRTDLDAAAFTDERDFTAKNKNAQAGTEWVYSYARGSLHIRYHFNVAERAYLDDSLYRSSPFVSYTNSRYTGRTHFAEIYSSWKGKNWEWLAGADYRQQQTDQWYYSTGPFGPYQPPVLDASMTQWSPYLSVIYQQKGFLTEFGGRINLHSVYGNNFSFTLNPSWRWREKVKFYANLYTAFKTPTLYQLYDGFSGNAGLQPEKGWIAEAGAEWMGGQPWTARVTAYYRNTRDAIVFTYNPAAFTGKYLNASRQMNYGLEAEVAYRKGQWDISFSYTYTDGKTSSPYDGTGVATLKDTSYFNLYRIPRHRLLSSVSYRATPRLFLRGSLSWQGQREEFIYGAFPEVMDGYALADLYAEYRLGTQWKLFADCRNMSNSRYTDIRGYATRGINWQSGVRFTW